MTDKETANEFLRLYKIKNVSIEANHIQIYQYNHSADDIDQLPLVFLHADCRAGQSVLEACLKLQTPPFHLAVINDTLWERDMTPWSAPAVFKKSEPFSGGGEKYLKKLEKVISVQIVEELGEQPQYMALAGYSLAGLFAVYAAYQSKIFKRVVSASASLWYQDFMAFTNSQKLSPQIESIYLSLGDQENHTKNQVLQTVEDKTYSLYQQLQKRGIQTVFEMNQGGHFKDSERRLAKGINWMLSHPAD